MYYNWYLYTIILECDIIDFDLLPKVIILITNNALECVGNWWIYTRVL